jgi:predicted helicase
MYARFYRWASDRIDEEQGIIAFITNNSFIDSKSFDGFRKCISREFDFIYVVNLAGDMRKNTDSNDNIFDITIGVSLLFLVKINNNPMKKAKLFYFRFDNCDNKQEKLKLLADSKFEKIDFARIIPDENYNWIDQTDNDFDSLMPVCDKQVKLGNSQQAIFSLFSNGVSTNRDEWVYDFSKENLTKKMQFFFKEYNNEVIRWKKWKKENAYSDIKAESNPVVDDFLHEINLIKWSKMLKRDKLRKHKKAKFDKQDIKECLYRPFVKNYLYNGYIPIDIKGEFNKILFNENKWIVFNNGALLPFNSIAVNSIIDLHFNGDSVCLPLYTQDIENTQSDNITDWALTQFKNQYPALEALNKLDIFYYVYAVLHNPAYREKYELNLKRDFPRIPFYENFMQWADYGKQLMELHLNYETAEHYPLKRQDLKISKIPKAKLKVDKEQGLIFLDDNTTLSEIPAAAWEYKLGNRSALEWILDQYKEKNPKDVTIAEQFNSYRFADYKEQVIELLSRVCTVSVETVTIVKALVSLHEIV